MPYCNLLIHAIWATKNRSPIITKAIKPILLSHIKDNSVKKGIFIKSMNCMPEHIHALISLGKDQSVAEVLHLIKGESSHWMNKQKLVPSKFEWQDEYIALSVSYSAADKVISYIDRQEDHHRKKTFTEEYNEFIKLAGIRLG